MTDLIRLRYLADVNPVTHAFDRMGDADEVSFLPLEAVWSDGRLDLGRTRPKAEVSTGYVRFVRGDVLCPKVTPTFQAGRAALMANLPTNVGAASTEVHVLRAKPERSDARYIRYGLLTKRFLEEGVSRFQGVAGLQRVPDSFVRNFEVVDHPLDEQRRIAAFLDDQVARIDKAIELVDARANSYLVRTRSVMIDEMLGPTGPLISVRRLILDERLGAWGTEPSGSSDVHVARVADFDRFNYRVTSAPTLRSLEPGQLVTRRIKNGDVLLERSGGGPGKPVGSAVVADFEYAGPIVCSNFISRLRPLEEVDGRYLSLALAAMYEARINAAFYTQTTGIQNLDSAAYLRFKIPGLSLAEQIRKRSKVEIELQESTNIRSLCAIQSNLLHERKRSLITAAVTGDFDVSSASPRTFAGATS